MPFSLLFLFLSANLNYWLNYYYLDTPIPIAIPRSVDGAANAPFFSTRPSTFSKTHLNRAENSDKCKTNHPKSHHTHSLLLHSHRQWYARHPPHDTFLYDVLHVLPNATLAEVQRNYKKLSREYHPDKIAWRRKKRRRNQPKGEQWNEEQGNDEEVVTSRRSNHEPSSQGTPTREAQLLPPPPPPPDATKITVTSVITDTSTIIMPPLLPTIHSNLSLNVSSLEREESTAEGTKFKKSISPTSSSLVIPHKNANEHANKIVGETKKQNNSKETVRRNDKPNLLGLDDNQYENDDGKEDDDEEEEYCRQKLAQLNEAYQILSNDMTRLLYHRYGIRDGPEGAVRLLTGRMVGSGIGMVVGEVAGEGETTPEQCRLLELMGYPMGGYYNHHRPQYYRDHYSESLYEQQRQRHHHLRKHHHHHHHHQSRQHHHNQHHNHHHHKHSTKTRQSDPNFSQHQQRLAYLTATITERLRPLVEGTVSQEVFIEDIYQECNALKKSALGAHILRCIGRAYRMEGRRVLRCMEWEKRQIIHKRLGQGHDINLGRSYGIPKSRNNPHQVTDWLQDGWRNAKHFCSAAVASGKLMLVEQKWKRLQEDYARQKQQQKERRKNRIEEIKQIKTGGGNEGHERNDEVDGKSANHFLSDGIGMLPGEERGDSRNDYIQYNDDSVIGAIFDDEEDEELLRQLEMDDDDHDNIEQELQYIQNKKTYTALLSAHQMEALWKITKIELDRAIREACRWILTPTLMRDGQGIDWERDHPIKENMQENFGHHSQSEEGWFAFCPSEQSPYWEEWQHYPYLSSSSLLPPPPPPLSHRHFHHRSTQRQDGWVGARGEVVPTDVGRLRAAAAMVLVGDIMVQCSKERTTWK